MIIVPSPPQFQFLPLSARKVYRQAGQFVFPDRELWFVYQGFTSNPSLS